jgi:CDP-6-deoxy-D-xylo-4-hexulose-3-dehydrase
MRAGDNSNMSKTASQLRDEIRAMVKQYYDVALAPQAFAPGQSSVPVSGKVFDSTEIESPGRSLA